METEPDKQQKQSNQAAKQKLSKIKEYLDEIANKTNKI